MGGGAQVYIDDVKQKYKKVWLKWFGKNVTYLPMYPGAESMSELNGQPCFSIGIERGLYVLNGDAWTKIATLSNQDIVGAITNYNGTLYFITSSYLYRYNDDGSFTQVSSVSISGTIMDAEVAGDEIYIFGNSSQARVYNPKTGAWRTVTYSGFTFAHTVNTITYYDGAFWFAWGTSTSSTCTLYKMTTAGAISSVRTVGSSEGYGVCAAAEDGLYICTYAGNIYKYDGTSLTSVGTHSLTIYNQSAHGITIEQTQYFAANNGQVIKLEDEYKLVDAI